MTAGCWPCRKPGNSGLQRLTRGIKPGTCRAFSRSNGMDHWRNWLPEVICDTRNKAVSLGFIGIVTRQADRSQSPFPVPELKLHVIK